MDLTIWKKGAQRFADAETWNINELKVELVRPDVESYNGTDFGAFVYVATEEKGQPMILHVEETVAEVLAAADTTTYPNCLISVAVEGFEGRADFLRGAASQTWLLSPAVAMEIRVQPDGGGSDIMYSGRHRQRTVRIASPTALATIVTAFNAGENTFETLTVAKIDRKNLPTNQTISVNARNIEKRIGSQVWVKRNLLTATRARVYEVA